jgi:electron transfer flavoprotein alpha/beta subunit
MGADQVLKRDLRTSSQLSHDLSSTNGTEVAAALQGLPLGVAVQESTRIEVSGTRGVDEVSKTHNSNVPALVTAQHDRTLAAAGDRDDAATASHAL